jgi:hypothetical protein
VEVFGGKAGISAVNLRIELCSDDLRTKLQQQLINNLLLPLIQRIIKKYFIKGGKFTRVGLKIEWQKCAANNGRIRKTLELFGNFPEIVSGNVS